jgi:hypothetical protein
MTRHLFPTYTVFEQFGTAEQVRAGTDRVSKM